MPKRSLIVLALPRGIVSGVGKLSVFLAPRLRENGDLKTYSADFADWSRKVEQGAKLQFTVAINGVDVPANKVTVPSRGTTPPVANAWRAIFGPPATTTFPVKKWTFVDRTATNLISTDTAAMSTLGEQLTLAYVRNGGVPLTKGQLKSQFPTITSVASQTAPYYGKVGNNSSPTTTTVDNEFHDTLRMLSSHPTLLRRLGLLWDLDIATMPATPFTHVSVRTNWPALSGAAVRDQVPVRTRVTDQFQAQVFRADYRAAEWLKVGGSKYAVSQIDSAQVPKRLADLAAVLNDASVPDSTPIDLPQFEDGGIGLVHRGIATVLMDQFDRQRELENTTDRYITNASTAVPLIYAEDITSGYRLDVQSIAPVSSTFRSLQDRSLPDGYEFPSSPALQIAAGNDEGWSTIALSTDGTPTTANKPSTVLYGDVTKRERTDTTPWRVPDQLAVWNGWSLATPKPSASTTGTGGVGPRPSNTPTTEYPGNVIADYVHVNGTLPSLRYGQTYRVRARCVDLGGRGPSLADSGPSGTSSADVVYGRLAPIAAPVVVRRKSRPDPGVGDMPDELVITSELDQVAGTITPTDRLLFPPSVPQSLVERHGLPGDGTDPAAYADLAARDAASLSAQCLVDPDTGEPVAGAAIVSGAVTQGPLKPSVTYLADPLASGVAFEGLPGQIGAVTMPLGTWPTLEAAALQFKGGTSAPTLDNANRMVTVFAPPGTTTEVTVSHVPAASLIGHMKGYQLLSPTDHSTTDAAILGGLNDGISRSRRLTLVHAVRLPLSAPSFPEPMTSERPEFPAATDGDPAGRIGQTTVAISGVIGAHRATTDHVSFRARWTDPDDTGATLEMIDNHGFVGDVFVPTDGDASTVGILGLTFDLGDTKRRTLTLSSEAFCRYSRYFTEQRRITAVPGATTVLNTAGVSPMSVEVAHRTNGTQYQRSRDFTVDATAGSITIVSGGTITNGTSLIVRYLRSPYSRRSSQAPEDQTTEVQVPSSRPPAPPVVVAIVPAFKRSATATANKITVTHDGRVVRVLLARPWYSSGEGEELGVAVDSVGVVTPVLTTWGRDPLSVGTGATVRPAVSEFPLATSTVAGVDGMFDVAAHAVVFDPTRNLWASDVQVDASFGYRPWVQLSLVRYQGLSVPTAHVSTPVQTEMVRLGEERVVTLDKLGGGMVRVTVTGRDNTNTMTAIVQQSPGALADSLLDWTDVRSAALTRSGTTSAASFTADVSSAGTGSRRLVIEEREPVNVDGGGTLTASSMVSYREVIPLPSGW